MAPSKRPSKTPLSNQERFGQLDIALMLPCLNEELTLAKVIRDFRAVHPGLQVYVFDNQSTDRSAEIALEEGATLVRVPKRGKGYVVRKMFEVVDADIYVMVDADATYDAAALPDLLLPLLSEEADMVVASRLAKHTSQAFRKFHRFGNSLIMTLINTIFRSRLTDICSGYRAMTRQFVKTIPLLRDGFEVETELTVYSLIQGCTIQEIPAIYGDRPPNSHSKLHTFRDGYKVLLTIVWLARDLRPLLFFGSCALVLFFAVTVPALQLYPQALFMHLALAFCSISLVVTGLILNTLNVKFSEMQLLQRRLLPVKRQKSIPTKSKKAA